MLADLLKQLEPGKLPLPVFLEIARLTVTPILEIVPLRKSPEGKIEILLLKREDDDPNWPGMLHTPGTVIRANDTEGSYNDAFNRILKGELNGVETGKPVFVTNMLHKVKRGMESAMIYWVEVLGEPTVGRFYDYENLPDNLIDTQVEFIKMAVDNYSN